MLHKKSLLGPTLLSCLKTNISKRRAPVKIRKMDPAAFGCRKTISGKYIFFKNANFRKRKMFSAVWLSQKSFSGKSIPVFGSSKHFTENTLQKSFYGKSFPVFGLWIIFTENMKCVTNSSTCIIYTTL